MLKKVILFLFLSLTVQLYAQVDSSARIIEYSGYKYYIHQVKKKDTMYSLSKAYGVSIRSIMAMNNKTSASLQEGELLRIPLAKSSSLKKESVSKTSINRNKTTRYDNVYYYHIAKPGETFISIARLYNIKVRKLKRINNEINPTALKPDSEIRIPIANASTEIAMLKIKKRKHTSIENKKTSSPKIPQIINNDNESDELGQIKSSYDLLLLLPLKDSWKGMRNYYNGMLSAIEEINNDTDFNVNIRVHDTQNSSFKTRILLDTYAKDADFILGPYSKQLFPLALPHANKKTTIVSLLSKNNEVFKNKHVLQLSTTEKTINKQIASYVIKNFAHENIISSNAAGFSHFYMIDSIDNNKNIDRLAEKLDIVQDQLTYDIKTDYSKDFELLFDNEKENIVIVPENDRKIVGQILSTLDILRNFKITVIGYYKWRFFTTIEPDLLYRLNTTYFTPFYYNATEELSFVKAYTKQFQAYPDDFSFMGYKTMKDLLSGIKQHGTHYYTTQPFIKKHNNGGFENIKLYRVILKNNNTIQVTEE